MEKKTVILIYHKPYQDIYFYVLQRPYVEYDNDDMIL